jgi:carbon monoxide dehydrogenase subunit G
VTGILIIYEQPYVGVNAAVVVVVVNAADVTSAIMPGIAVLELVTDETVVTAETEVTVDTVVTVPLCMVTGRALAEPIARAFCK